MMPALRNLLALAILAILATPAAAWAARPALDWLRYDPEVLENYAVESVAGDSARSVATPTWSGGVVKPKNVLLLIPFKSVDAYSISVNTILTVFRERKIPTRFDIWFYDRNEAIAKEALSWAARESIDLIMPVGSIATEWLHANYRGGKLPVVTSASKDPVPMGQMPDYASGSGTNFAYTSINVPTDTMIAYLLQLIPNLRTIGVLYSEDNRSAIETQVRPLQDVAPRYKLSVHEIAVRNEKTAVTDLNANLPRALERMRAYDPKLEASILLVTGSTAVYDQIAIINQHAGNVPVIATLPDVVRPGDETAVLSIGVNQSSAVQLAAVYAIDILTGRARPGDLKVGVVTPPDIAISFRKARQIGLKIPFNFLESATFVYDYEGRRVRAFGQRVLVN